MKYTKHTHYHLQDNTDQYISVKNILGTRNTFCGTWYMSRSHYQVHNERTASIIMAGCITHARNGHI